MSTVIKGSGSGQINLNDTTGSIQLNGSDVLTIDSSGNLTAPNNLTVTGTVSSTGDVAFDTDTLYVDATNNRVGIGTTSPNTKLQSTVGSNGSGAVNAIRLQNVGTTAGDGAKLLFTAGTSTDGAGIAGLGQALNSANLVFYSGGNTERMRIDSSGNVFIGKTTTGYNTPGISFTPNGACSFATNANSGNILFSAPVSQSQIAFYRQDTGALMGYIINGASNTVSYATSSDYRLKENVAPMSGNIDRLKQLKPSTWSWTIDGSYGEGFLAHEAQAVVPEAVHGTKDAMRTEEYEVTPAVLDEDGNVVTEAVMGTREVPDYQGIDQSKLVPLLTAALQEAITKIEDLETRIQTLESA